MTATRTSSSTTLKPLLGRYYVKGMTVADLDSVAYIEKTSSETFWEKADFGRVLKEPGMQGRVIQGQGQYAGETIGYYLFQLLDFEVHLWNLTLDPAYRRKKIGTTILSNLVRDYAKPLTCYVRDSNLAAHRCLQTSGFQATQVRRGYFVDYHADGTADFTDAYYFVLARDQT